MRVWTCAEWHALPKSSVKLEKRPAVGIVVHHTAGPNTQPEENEEAERARCFRLALSIQKAHLQRGWRDSGHHWLISRSGIVLEGRHDSLAQAKLGKVVRGSHAGDPLANLTMYGIECEGTYTDESPPAALWAALADLCAHLAWWGRFQSQAIYGHRIYRATQCPGDELFAKLPDLRRAVRDRKLELMSG